MADIPYERYKENEEVLNYGTFTRDKNTNGMQEIKVTSDDTSKGTVDTPSVFFVNYVLENEELNATTLLPMADGTIKVGNTFVHTSPVPGYEVSY